MTCTSLSRRGAGRGVGGDPWWWSRSLMIADSLLHFINAMSTPDTTTKTPAAGTSAAPSFRQARKAVAAELESTGLFAARASKKHAGQRVLSPTAAAMLSLAIANPAVSSWELKGGGRADQTSGPIGPMPPANSREEAAIAAEVDAFLAPLRGMGLRIVRFESPKRGVSYFGTVTVAGR